MTDRVCRIQRAAWAGLSLLALMLAAGCGDPADAPAAKKNGGGSDANDSPPSAAAKSDQRTANADKSGGTPAARKTSADRTDADSAGAGGQEEETPTEEFWEAFYIRQGDADAVKAGYSHTRIWEWGERDELRRKTESRTQLSFLRSGQVYRKQITVATVTDHQDHLLRCHAQVGLSDNATMLNGTVEDGKFVVDLTTGRSSESRTLAWPSEAGGYFAVERSLARQPIHPGDQRGLQVLQPPPINSLQEVKLQAGQRRSTSLLGVQATLLPVREIVQMPGGIETEVTLWVDEQGQVLKRELPAGVLTLTSYRVPKEIALEEDHGAPLDLGFDIAVRLEEPLPRAHRTQRAIYEITYQDGNPAEIFVADKRQTVEPIAADTARVTVTASPTGEADDAGKPTLLLGPGHLEPSSLVQSDNAKIAALAEGVLPGESDLRNVALALEGFVHDYVRRKNYSQALATALEVVESQQGDCTEHTVLLVALCRARGIPARAALGLVYNAAIESFAYHMWAEVLVDDDWMPLDATLGQGGIGAAHLKLGQTDLTGPEAYASFFKLLRVLGKLQIRVVEAE